MRVCFKMGVCVCVCVTVWVCVGVCVWVCVGPISPYANELADLSVSTSPFSKNSRSIFANSRNRVRPVPQHAQTPHSYVHCLDAVNPPVFANSPCICTARVYTYCKMELSLHVTAYRCTHMTEKQCTKHCVRCIAFGKYYYLL